MGRSGGLQKIKFTDERKEELLDLVNRGVTVKAAAKAVGVNIATVNKHLTNDAAFRAALDGGREVRAEIAEHEAFNRAVNGWWEKTYERDEDGEMVLVKSVRKYDNRLLARFLEAHRPEVWAPHSKLDIEVRSLSRVELDAVTNVTLDEQAEDAMVALALQMSAAIDAGKAEAAAKPKEIEAG